MTGENYVKVTMAFPMCEQSSMVAGARMIKYEDGRWYVVAEDGHRLTGGCDSEEIALKEEMKCKYFMSVSKRKVERSKE